MYPAPSEGPFPPTLVRSSFSGRIREIQPDLSLFGFESVTRGYKIVLLAWYLHHELFSTYLV